jgi:uncharacterized protein
MKDDNPLLFKVSDLREQGQVTLALDLPRAGFADAFDGPDTLKKLSAELRFTAAEDDLLLQGTVTAELTLHCARCDAPVTRSYSDSFDELYPYSLEYINAHEPVRETAGLLAPLKVLCSDSCRGRCPACGGDLNKKNCGCRAEKASPFGALKDFKPEKDARQEPPDGKKTGGVK